MGDVGVSVCVNRCLCGPQEVVVCVVCVRASTTSSTMLNQCFLHGVLLCCAYFPPVLLLVTTSCMTRSLGWLVGWPRMFAS